MDVEAPWPGTVQQITVAVGDTVVEGQELLTLEAMKMLTPVPSPRAGSVTAIHVHAGDFVDQGAKLLTLDEG